MFRDDDSEEGTFGPSMSAAMSMHRDKKDKKKEKSEKDKHLDKAKEHLDKAVAAGGDEHDPGDDDESSDGMSSLMDEER
jgi:hypothetical protein